MYDTWVQAFEEGNMAGVMMIDLSAAFYMDPYFMSCLPMIYLMSYMKINEPRTNCSSCGPCRDVYQA